MKKIYIYSSLFLIILLVILLASCGKSMRTSKEMIGGPHSGQISVWVEAEDYTGSSQLFGTRSYDSGDTCLHASAEGWVAYEVNIPVAGRYRSVIRLSADTSDRINCWIEDYHDNQDNRTYNITGNMEVAGPTSGFTEVSKDGSPLNAGLHRIKIHFDKCVDIDRVVFELIKPRKATPVVLKQQMLGNNWDLVWSDEFEGESIDTSNWTFDLGDWGWGNNELQYYTVADPANARLEDGNLVIEARKGEDGTGWTSARLTTREKLSFIYGKIEFRAKVPSGRGNWAAGWTLGDDYVDELSWPYCGEIDILESVGFEMDDRTGNGKAHASTHSGAYYFKLGNQPTGIVEVENMNNAYHLYSVEWTAEWIKAYVDDRLYITYDDTSTDLSWPFDRPQNIILNLAMGGGWGGAHGIDESLTSQKMIIDYVRVYERK